MSWFKKKRNPCKVIVHFDNLTNSKFARRRREIAIPDGYTFKCGFAEHARLLNRNGEIAWVYNWRAGYEVTYEYIYD